MSSLSYWEKRKARETYEELRDVEEKAVEVANLYAKASAEISKETERIIRKFGIEHGLSEKDATELLKKVRDPEDIKKLIKELKKNPKNQELVTELEANAYGARLARLSVAQVSIDATVKALYNPTKKIFNDMFERIAEDRYYQELFAMQQRADAVFAFNPYDPKRLDDILDRRWSGKSFSERLWGNTEDLARRAKEELMTGLLTGKSSFKMSKAIEETFHAGATAARRLMRTEATYVLGQIAIETYKETGVDKYIYVAILDLKTSKICRSLDKKRFLVKNAQPGENYPPMHPWCRSTTIAWMPEELLKKLQQSAIDPVTGERIKIPANITYQEWYNEYVSNNREQKTIRLRLNYFDPNEDIYLDSFSIEEEPGFEDICCHGNANNVEVYKDGRYQVMDAIEFAEHINQIGDFHGQDLRFASCAVGQGDNSFAQQLSKVLNIRVKAPDMDVFYSPEEGTVFIGSAYRNIGRWRVFENGVEI